MLFKLGFGFLADRLGAVRASSVYLLIGLTGTLLMTFFRAVPFLMIAGPAMYSANFSVATVGVSLITQRTAKDRYAEVYSRLTILATSTYALMTTFYGFLSDRFNSYQPGMYIVICLSLTGLIMIHFLDRKAQ